KQCGFAANYVADATTRGSRGGHEPHGRASPVHKLRTSTGKELVVFVRFLKGFADDYAINKVSHDAVLRLQFADNSTFIAVYVYNLHGNTLVPAHRKRLRFQLEDKFPRFNIKAKSFKVRSLFKVEEDLAIDKTVAVVILIEIPGGYVAGIGLLVVSSATLTIKDGYAFETDDSLRLLAVLDHLDFDVR